MVVYFAQARIDRTTVKIGFTADLRARQKNLSISTPGGVSILATLAGGMETEDFLHDKFARHRIGGEWFRFDEEVRDFIRDVQNGKSGLVPFRDNADYMLRTTSEYASDAVERARSMISDIIAAEKRDIHDTTGAAIDRLARRHGFAASMLRRLIYREMNDVSAGVYLHLQDVHDRICRGARASAHTFSRSLPQ